MEVFFEVACFDAFIGNWILLAQKLHLINRKLCLAKNGDNFILSWVASEFAQQIDSAVFRFILEYFSALEQTEINILRLLTHFVAESFYFRIKKSLELVLTNLYFSVK